MDDPKQISSVPDDYEFVDLLSDDYGYMHHLIVQRRRQEPIRPITIETFVPNIIELDFSEIGNLHPFEPFLSKRVSTGRPEKRYSGPLRSKYPKR